MDYRYERKMLIENRSRAEVETLVKLHSAFFREIHNSRYINNIYFDYIDFKNFQDNITGNVDRLKYRIRWYGDLLGPAIEPQLELKIKKGIVGTKKNFLLNNFTINKGMSSKELKNFILVSNIDEQLKIQIKNQIPVILNRYKRRYFESIDKKFRITIDDSQSFYKINNFNNLLVNKIVDNNNIILELKYDKKDDLEAQNIIKELPFRITKSSKYSRAVEMFYV